MERAYYPVEDLTPEQLSELKESYWMELLDTDDADTYDSWTDIPDDIILDHYSGIVFVDEDFFCTCLS